jgi:hypothetical protein
MMRENGNLFNFSIEYLKGMEKFLILKSIYYLKE